MNSYYKLICWSFFITLWTELILSSQDYYSLLGIYKNAKDKEIRKAFRKLAMQYHPDKNKEEGAEEKFREIAEAYEVLSDSDKRREYNMMGHQRYTNKENHGNEFHDFKPTYMDLKDLFKQFDFDEFDSEPFEQGDPFMQFNDDFMNMDDLFGDKFGSHDSFFHGSHFQGRQANHFQRHARQHQAAHQKFHKMHDMMFNSFEGGEQQQNCKTVVQKVGNMVTQYTTCS